MRRGKGGRAARLLKRIGKGRLAGAAKAGLMLWGVASLAIVAVGGLLLMLDLLPGEIARPTRPVRTGIERQPTPAAERRQAVPAERRTAAARLPRPRPAEPLMTGSIETSEAGRYDPADDLAALVRRDARLDTSEALLARAGAVAAASPACDRVLSPGMLDVEDTRPDRMTIVVHCRNGQGFHFTARELVRRRG